MDVLLLDSGGLNMKQKTIGILGLGIFGSSVCKTLANYDCDVIAIDLDIKNVHRIEEYVTTCAQGDITDFDTLKNLGLDNCDTVIISTGSNLEATILAILNVKQLGVDNIIVKARNKTYMNIFNQLGCNRIVRPEREMGEKIARDLMRNKIVDAIDLDEENAIIEFLVPSSWLNKSLVELDVRRNYNINVIGYRDSKNHKLNLSLDADFRFKDKQIVVAIGNIDHFEQLDLNNKL